MKYVIIYQEEEETQRGYFVVVTKAKIVNEPSKLRQEVINIIRNRLIRDIKVYELAREIPMFNVSDSQTINELAESLDKASKKR